MKPGGAKEVKMTSIDEMQSTASAMSPDYQSKSMFDS
jgi:hypothetical protein